MVRNKPVLILVSGKRVVGKDHFLLKLLDLVLSARVTARGYASAEWVKREYAAEHQGVELVRLFTDRPYKDLHRDMIIDLAESKRLAVGKHWIEQTVSKIREDYVNCKTATFIPVVTDLRFMSEVEFLREECVDFDLVFVRLEASNEVRAQRGWTYVPKIDDSASETDLDHYDRFDFIFKSENETQTTATLDVMAKHGLFN